MPLASLLVAAPNCGVTPAIGLATNVTRAPGDTDPFIRQRTALSTVVSAVVVEFALTRIDVGATAIESGNAATKMTLSDRVDVSASTRTNATPGSVGATRIAEADSEPSGTTLAVAEAPGSSTPAVVAKLM